MTERDDARPQPPAAQPRAAQPRAAQTRAAHEQDDTARLHGSLPQEPMPVAADRPSDPEPAGSAWRARARGPFGARALVVVGLVAVLLGGLGGFAIGGAGRHQGDAGRFGFMHGGPGFGRPPMPGQGFGGRAPQGAPPGP